MHACARCDGEVDEPFRYCPWCGAPQRLKLVEFFASHPLLASDRGRSLRVSRYLGPRDADRHVRFSVWSERGGSAEATAAVSLDEAEATRLARFLAAGPAPPRRRLSSVVRDLRDACLTRR
jgi:hypothetical protein